MTAHPPNTATAVFFAPARINLIGEHIDYTQGRVLPASLTLGTRVTMRPRADRQLSLHSVNLDESLQVSLQLGARTRRGHWSDYVCGVAWALEELGISLAGAQLEIESDVPLGAGLASSAALEVATALALLERAGRRLPARELALACLRAESDWVGTRCGPMDQLIALYGRCGQALLLDCATLESRVIDVPADGAWILADTRVHHAHASGEYNARRSESEQLARAAATGGWEMRSLRDFPSEDVAAIGAALSPVLARRLRHIATENRRVLDAVSALQRADLPALGALLSASHKSLRDDYEVSCPELDAMVELACVLPGVFGARMHGGGFGGCALILAAADRAAQTAETLRERYERATGIVPWIHLCRIGDAARRLR